MRYEAENDLGYFEGYNFRTQSAIFETLSAEDVINWDHDQRGEAEFWPEGSNIFVRLLSPRECTASDLREIDRIFSELEDSPELLARAVYLKDSHGLELKDITREAVENACLYVYGPDYVSELKKEAAWEIFEELYPEAYKLVESWTVPGVSFDEEQFLYSFSIYTLKTEEFKGYLIVEPC